MAAERVYTADDALTITAFPLSDDNGYIVRVGELDHDGVFLGTVFHEEGRWAAYASSADRFPVLIGVGEDLDDLMTEYFLEQVRLSDELHE